MVTIKDKEILIDKFTKDYKNATVAKYFYDKLYIAYGKSGISENEIDIVETKFIPVLIKIDEAGNLDKFDAEMGYTFMTSDPIKLLDTYAKKDDTKTITKDISDEQMAKYIEIIRGDFTIRQIGKDIISDGIIKYEITNYLNGNDQYSPSSMLTYVKDKLLPKDISSWNAVKYKAWIMAYLKIDFPDQTVGWLENEFIKYYSSKGSQNLLYGYIKTAVRDQVLIKDRPDQIIKEAYDIVLKQFPGLNSDYLLERVKKVTDNGKKPFDLDQFKYIINSDIKNDPNNPVYNKTDDGRSPMYKGRITSKTWLENNGNLLFLIVASTCALAWYYRKTIIEAILEYKIKHSIVGEFKYIPQSLELSSSQYLSEVMKPPTNIERERIKEESERVDVETKKTNLAKLKSEKSGKTRFDTKTSSLKSDEKEEEKKFERKEGKWESRKLKLTNTKNILDNSEIMNGVYKNNYELADKIGKVLGITDKDYFMSDIWEALQPKNREGIKQKISNDLNKAISNIKKGIGEAYESLEIGKNLSEPILKLLPQKAQEEIKIDEDKGQEAIIRPTRIYYEDTGAGMDITKEEFKKLTNEIVQDMMLKYPFGIQSTNDPDRVYYYRKNPTTDEERFRPNLIITSLNDPLKDKFDDIINVPIKIVMRVGKDFKVEHSNSTEFQKIKTNYRVRGKDIVPFDSNLKEESRSINNDRIFIYDDKYNYELGIWRYVQIGPNEIESGIPYYAFPLEIYEKKFRVYKDQQELIGAIVEREKEIKEGKLSELDDINLKQYLKQYNSLKGQYKEIANKDRTSSEEIHNIINDALKELSTTNILEKNPTKILEQTEEAKEVNELNSAIADLNMKIANEKNENISNALEIDLNQKKKRYKELTGIDYDEAISKIIRVNNGPLTSPMTNTNDPRLEQMSSALNQSIEQKQVIEKDKERIEKDKERIEKELKEKTEKEEKDKLEKEKIESNLKKLKKDTIEKLYKTKEEISGSDLYIQLNRIDTRYNIPQSKYQKKKKDNTYKFFDKWLEILKSVDSAYPKLLLATIEYYANKKKLDKVREIIEKLVVPYTVGDEYIWSPELIEEAKNKIEKNKDILNTDNIEL